MIVAHMNTTDKRNGHSVPRRVRSRGYTVPCPLFKDYQRAKVGTSVETQCLLAGIENNALLEYTLAQTGLNKPKRYSSTTFRKC